MTNVLAILILASGFSVAVETSGGFVERTFSNSEAGVAEFVDFAEPLLLKEGKRVKVCTVNLSDDSGEVMSWLLENDMGPALLSAHAYRKYIERSGESLEAATSVARACLSVFPFIRRT